MVVEDFGMVLGILELLCRRVEYEDFCGGGIWAWCWWW